MKNYCSPKIGRKIVGRYGDKTVVSIALPDYGIKIKALENELHTSVLILLDKCKNMDSKNIDMLKSIIETVCSGTNEKRSKILTENIDKLKSIMSELCYILPEGFNTEFYNVKWTNLSIDTKIELISKELHELIFLIRINFPPEEDD